MTEGTRDRQQRADDRITVTFTRYAGQRLRERAEAKGVAIAAIVRAAVNRYLKEEAPAAPGGES